MAQGSDFKFISIEDDDEIVIQAGATSSQAADQVVGDAAEAESELASDWDDDVDEDGLFPEDEDLEEGLAEESDEDAAERERFEREKARRQARAEANRMVTTEEDLKASVPFASMQRIIIIVAIILIVVFVAYYQLGVR